MRVLPLDHPGIADHRSAGRLLWWLGKGQWHTLAMGMFFGITWMSTQAVMPFVIGRAIDLGVADRDTGVLVKYAGLMLLIGVVQAASGIMRHRYAVTNWLTAAYRTVQLVGRQAVQLGGTLPRKVSTGEVVAIGDAEVDRPPDHRGHHGLRAHPRDAEDHAHREGAPLTPSQPPQQSARRPVVGDAGVFQGQDAHLSTLGTRSLRSERFSGCS